ASSCAASCLSFCPALGHGPHSIPLPFDRVDQDRLKFIVDEPLNFRPPVIDPLSLAVEFSESHLVKVHECCAQLLQNSVFKRFPVVGHRPVNFLCKARLPSHVLVLRAPSDARSASLK